LHELAKRFAAFSAHFAANSPIFYLKHGIFHRKHSFITFIKPTWFISIQTSARIVYLRAS